MGLALNSSPITKIWVFNGERAFLPSAVFLTLELAEQWIKEKQVSGLLTAYPVNTGVYDWALTRGCFQPKHSYQQLPAFIQRFTSAYLEHFHYENGERL